MGRRSISSTKAGKFMNPTDQASKFSSFFVVVKFDSFLSLTNK